MGCSTWRRGFSSAQGSKNRPPHGYKGLADKISNFPEMQDERSNCTGTDVSNKFGQSDGRPFHLLESLFFRDGHRSFFDDLLVTALDRTITSE
jgi:hypothetical protein